MGIVHFFHMLAHVSELISRTWFDASGCKYLESFCSSPDFLQRTPPNRASLWGLFWTQCESVLLCLSQHCLFNSKMTSWQCYPVAWQQSPQGRAWLLSRGSLWAWCYKVCRALFTQPWCLWSREVPRAWWVCPCFICSSPVEEKLFWRTWETVALHKLWRVQGLFLAVSFSPSCLSMQKCSSICSTASSTCTRCALVQHCLLVPWLLLVSPPSFQRRG